MASLLLVLVVVCNALLLAHGKLLMVQTVTRHGERAPDKIVTTQSCRAIWPNVKTLKKDFDAFPGRLTPLGVQKMRDVGAFLRRRYIENGFVDDDYQRHPDQWDLVAREGFRQQRSMSAIALGIFPNEPMPVKVVPRLQDSSVGGPAPACGPTTAKMIVEWYKTKGKEAMEKEPDTVHAFEKICDVDLTGNPVNAKPGGPNPHAWIGDISDSLDSAFAVGVKLPKSITPELHEQLTELAFGMEQGSHYDDPRGAIMFSGDFPNMVLKAFEAWEGVPEGSSKGPKKTPRMRLHSCSRELLYGLQHLFGWATELEGQPRGRVSSGTTFIWELHREHDILHPEETGLVVRSLYWSPGMAEPAKLQEDVALTTLRATLENYTKTHGGTWDELCDFKHFNAEHNHHDSDFLNPLVTQKDEPADAGNGDWSVDSDYEEDDKKEKTEEEEQKPKSDDTEKKEPESKMLQGDDSDEEKGPQTNQTEMLEVGAAAAHSSGLFGFGVLGLAAGGVALAVQARNKQTAGYSRI